MCLPPPPPPSAGVCTECGVCDGGENFGENVVHPPPAIPAFEGHYRPNSTRAQRLRFRCAKRALGARRSACLPVSFGCRRAV